MRAPVKADEPDRKQTMEYPTQAELAGCLKDIASEVGDASTIPFRVDVVPLHGGKPPMYAVVILSASKEPLRQKLANILSRSFSLGVSSFMLNGDEAASILKYCRPD